MCSVPEMPNTVSDIRAFFFFSLFVIQMPNHIRFSSMFPAMFRSGSSLKIPLPTKDGIPVAGQTALRHRASATPSAARSRPRNGPLIIKKAVLFVQP